MATLFVLISNSEITREVNSCFLDIYRKVLGKAVIIFRRHSFHTNRQQWTFIHPSCATGTLDGGQQELLHSHYVCICAEFCSIISPSWKIIRYIFANWTTAADVNEYNASLAIFHNIALAHVSVRIASFVEFAYCPFNLLYSLVYLIVTQLIELLHSVTPYVAAFKDWLVGDCWER